MEELGWHQAENLPVSSPDSARILLMILIVFFHVNHESSSIMPT